MSADASTPGGNGPAPRRQALAELRDTLAARRDALQQGDAAEVVELLLSRGRAAGASDLHVLPQPDGVALRARVDGVLQPLGTLPAAIAANVVARLKVLADLLTYRTDVPQEGRIRLDDGAAELRLSTLPTLHGEKAVVRFFDDTASFRRIADLGFPPEVESALLRLLTHTSGAVLVTGPAGSGKTTTLYCCLRELAVDDATPRNLVSLEDPIEVALQGVAQSQVDPAAGFDLPTGLRFLMRQDPEVIMVGEIRDRPTAEAALQASLTGHLVLSSFHAASAAAAVGRLTDMGLEPYVLRSGVLAVLSQRLVRRLCTCATACEDEQQALGLPVAQFRLPVGCSECGGTGYRGRAVLAELFETDRSDVGRAILSRAEVATLEQLAIDAGMTTLWQRAALAVEQGLTSPAEVRRVLGFGRGEKREAGSKGD